MISETRRYWLLKSEPTCYSIDDLERDGTTLRKGYTFSYMIVPDPRMRALLEAYAIGRLCPAHLG